MRARESNCAREVIAGSERAFELAFSRFCPLLRKQERLNRNAANDGLKVFPESIGFSPQLALWAKPQYKTSPGRGDIFECGIAIMSLASRALIRWADFHPTAGTVGEAAK